MDIIDKICILTTGETEDKKQDKILLLNLGFFVSYMIAQHLNTVFNLTFLK